MAKPKISFKKQPKSTGLSATAYQHQDIDIKLNKQCIGSMLISENDDLKKEILKIEDIELRIKLMSYLV